MKHAKTKQISVIDSKVLRLFVGLALVVGLMPSASFANQETAVALGSEEAVEEVAEEAVEETVVEQPEPSVGIVAADESEQSTEQVEAVSQPKPAKSANRGTATTVKSGAAKAPMRAADDGDLADANDAEIAIVLSSAPVSQTAEQDVDYYNDPVSISVKVTDSDFASGTVKVMRDGAALDGKTTSITASDTEVQVPLSSTDTADGAVTIEVETKDSEGATKTYSYGPDSEDGKCTTKANDSAVTNTKLAVNVAPQVAITWEVKGVGSISESSALFLSTATAENAGVVATITVTDKTLFSEPGDSNVTITAADAALGEWSGSNGVYTRTATFAYEADKTVTVSATATDGGELSTTGDGSITMTVDDAAPTLDVQYYTGTDSASTTTLYSDNDADATTDSVTVKLTITEANPLNAGNIVVNFGDGPDDVDLSDLEPDSEKKYTLTHTYSGEGIFTITVAGNNSERGARDAAGNPLEESGAISGKYRATVTVDKTAPTVDVAYYVDYGTNGSGSSEIDAYADNGATVYAANKMVTAKITVADLSFDTTNTSITLTSDPSSSGTKAEVRTYAGEKTWTAIDAGEDGIPRYVALVDFDVNGLTTSGEFELRVEAADIVDQKTSYPSSSSDTAVVVIDKASPRLTVAFPDEPEPKSHVNKAEKDEVRYYDGSAEVNANVSVEDRFVRWSTINVEVKNESTNESVTVPRWTNVKSDEKTMTVTFPQPDEGAEVTYDLSITGHDLSRNEIVSGDNNAATYVDTGTGLHRYATKVVLDRKAPVLSVDWDNTNVLNGKYYAAARTATIKVDENNFDENLISIDTITGSVGSWNDEGNGVHTIEVKFDKDGTHELKVSGTDLSGNKLTGGGVDDGEYYSGEFVIDMVAPVVTFEMSQAPSNKSQAPSNNSASGVDYYRSGNQLTVTVKVDDVNFDPANNKASETETVITPTGTFEKAYQKQKWDRGSYEVVFTPNDAYGAAPSNTLSAVIYDLAGNKTEFAYGKAANDKVGKTVSGDKEISGNANFTLDVTAPVIVPGNGSDVPNRVYSGNYSDTLVFYKDATTLRIVVNDAIGIDSITGKGSDYSFDAVSGESGDKSWTMDVSLRDGKEFTDDFLLTATDLAQNVRKWKISPKTLEVDDVAKSDATSLPLYGDEPELYPIALIQDTTAPTISVTGATPGAYYNSTQAITTAIEELNFKYLKQYDGSQVITTVTKKAGNATRASSTTTIPVSSFSGSESSYSNVFQAADDGHYSFAAHITDPAGNEASASLGEFTIDKTAPVASISWDNTDVRNDKYYAAARTATITVVEHNFDASRVSITTTGSVGAWIDNGDTHTIQVSFGSDGTYNLSVAGTDLAGNVMNELTEPEFVIDMTAPNIEISVVENGYAYGKDVAVAPVITFTDEANFDPNGTSYTLTGSKNGEVSYDAGSSDGDNSRTVTYGDFGADRGGSYDPNADDIYTLHASMTDMAGNTATEQTVTFSVNRYGSTYRILEGDYTKENAYLDEAPEVRIQEINVSGTVPEKNSIVVSPEGASQKYLTMNAAAAQTGYTVSESTSTEGASRGWSTYTYAIAPGNFDHDARYHVVVTSEDRATNRNTSTGYFNRDKGESDAKAEVVFVLDENAPEVVGLHVTGGELDEYYEGEFSVHEDIGIANVEVTLAGEPLEVEDLGGNNYAFKAPSRSFAPSRELVVTATDLSNKSGTDGIDLRSLLIALPVGVVVVVGVVVAAVFTVRRRGLGKHSMS